MPPSTARAKARVEHAWLQGELVEKLKVADRATAGLQQFEIAGLFSINVDAKPGADLAVIERVVRKELERFLKEGPTAAELSRLRSDIDAYKTIGMQSVDTKAAILAQWELYTGDPGFDDRDTEWQQQATAEDVRRAANLWLTKPNYSLILRPFGDYHAVPASFDRKQ